jgi:uncharacterized DUF497 family protein
MLELWRTRSDSTGTKADIGHIARHGVTPEEAQEALANDPLEVGSEYVGEEERFRSVGRTDSGRWLLVVSTACGERTRVITAYDASKRHIELYLTSKDGDPYESDDSTF